ncbi:MAG: hypothetical protein LBE76_01110 [Nitrososphaerota archaeon]|jgi:hypothetical protein|nr:hypothetical protein [Nitrososphaerota archaeon]
MNFPQRLYTTTEIRDAKILINQGYKHTLIVDGTIEFKTKVNQAIKYLETSGYYDFFRTYIKEIIEIDGLTQLRETEISIWANQYAVENPVDAASLLVQKAYSMKEYLDGEVYYGGNAEKRSLMERIHFLQTLKEKTLDPKVIQDCQRLLDLWSESSWSF